MKTWAHFFENDCQDSEALPTRALLSLSSIPWGFPWSLHMDLWAPFQLSLGPWSVLQWCSRSSWAQPHLCPFPLDRPWTPPPALSWSLAAWWTLALEGHLLCLRLLINPLTAPSSLHCIQTLRDGACQRGHWVPWGHPGLQNPCPLRGTQPLLHPDGD